MIGLATGLADAGFLLRDEVGQAYFPATLLTEAMALVGAVRVEGSVQKMRGRLGSLRMKAFVCDDLVAEGAMSFAL